MPALHYALDNMVAFKLNPLTDGRGVQIAAQFLTARNNETRECRTGNDKLSFRFNSATMR